MAEARLILAKTFWTLNLNLPKDADPGWIDQEAYLVFAPKPLFVEVSQHTADQITD